MNLSTYGANAILDGTAMPATLYVQLHIGDPTAAGTANVSATTGRRSFTRTAAAAGVADNAALLEWLTPSADEDLTHVTVWDASSGGNCWWVGDIAAAPVEALTVQAIEIPVNTLIFTFDIWS